MRVDVKRSGGFAGIGVRASLSDDELSPADAQAILELVARFEAPRSPADRGRAAPDRFQYELTVSDQGHERHATVWENELAPDDSALLARLIQRAR
jgi:hypothetical protein